MKKPMKKAASKKMSEYGGMEMYGNKKAMMKHEKMEGKKMEMKEKAMYAKAKPMMKTKKKK
jgi:hypothetical protein